MNKTVKIVVWSLTIFFFVMTLVIIIAGTLALKSNKPLTLFNYTFSVVPTNSMEPDIKAGDFVIGKKVSFASLEKDDDVIFYSAKENIYIVHRIYSDESAHGFITKGINNGAVDEGYLTDENFVSKAVWNGGLFGLGKNTTNYRGLIMVFLVLMFLVILLKEALNIYKAFAEHKAEQRKLENAEITDEEKEKMRNEIMEQLHDEGLIDKENETRKDT